MAEGKPNKVGWNLAPTPEKRFDRKVPDLCRSSRRRPLLRMDRWSEEESRRKLVAPKVHSEASSKFIEAKDHLEFHDRRLWDLRKKRDRESVNLPEWEELRAL
ncbi:MAG: hypothetical protein V4760_08310, partial [Bdellovibrionota bacterium]